MTSGLRVALVSVVSAVALVFAGSALAAYTPHITINHTPLTVGSTGTTDLTISFDQNDDATLKVTFYVPEGYQAGLIPGQVPGTEVGTVDASVLAKLISPTQPLALKGTIRTDDPTKYTAAATQCTGVPTHEVVLVLALQAAGRELDVPLYVDPTAGAETAVGAFKLQACLPSPDIPEAAGGAAFGSKLISATLHFKSSVFTLPTQNGSYGWTVVATPYVSGTATPNPAGTVQARALVQLPAQLTLKAKVKKKTATLSGALKLNLAGMAGQKVTLLSGSSRTKLKAAGSATTRAGGAFSFRKTVRKATYFRVRVSVPVRAATCTGGVPGIPCAGATANAFTAQSAVIKVAPKKR
jgi:hypothetical protein